MNSSDMAAKVEAAVPPATRDAFVEEIQFAYEAVGQHYQEDEGWDDQLVGFTLWKFVGHNLSERVTDEGRKLGLQVRDHANTFRLQAGPFIIGTYRVFPEPLESLDRSFPNNANGAGQLARRNQRARSQHWLFDGSLPEEEPVRALVLAHAGNPEDGLTALWLAEPTDEHDGRITDWGYSRPLWSVVKNVSDQPSEQVLPTEERIRRPEAQLKEKASQQSSESAGE